MKLFRTLFEEDDEPISTGELNHVEKYLNQVWEKLGIDFEFTKHFFERVNDPRNGKQIKAKELVKIFTDVYKKYGQMIAKKVTPDTEKTFDSVLTDLSTKVNSPVIVVWNKAKKELEMIAKTVMRVNHFYNHPDQTRLTVQQYEPEGTVITEKKMKTYKDLTEWVGWNTPEVAPITTPQAVDDVDSAAFSVEKPEILDKLNGYCHDIANHQYINPYYPLNALWKKLMLVGINFDLKQIMLIGEQGRVSVPINMYGGRSGALGNPASFVSKDDGVTDRIPGGLDLVVTFQKTGGVYSLDVTIQRGSVLSAVGFGEEAVNEAELTETQVFTHKIWTGPSGVKKYANMLHKHYPNVKAGTEHVYVHTNHPAEHVADTMKNKLGLSGFKAYQFQTKKHQFGADQPEKKVTEAKEFHSTGSYTNHPYHKVLTSAGYEHESSHDQDPRGRVHTYFHPKSQHVISIGSTMGKPAWGSEQATGHDAKGLAQHIKDVHSISPEDAKKWRVARPTVKKK